MGIKKISPRDLIPKGFDSHGNKKDSYGNQIPWESNPLGIFFNSHGNQIPWEYFYPMGIKSLRKFFLIP